MHIRKATEADLPAIVRMSACFYPTTCYPLLCPMDEASVEGVARACMGSGVLLVAEHDGEAVGMVGLIFSPFMFNATKTLAYEVVWWVDEAARSTGAGRALLSAVEPACREAGADAVVMIHMANSPPQAALLYERAGYAHTESSYTKRLT
jgi:GNAT superfamily N-acetyltransferase